MATAQHDYRDLIDGRTSRTICAAVGEKLRQKLEPEAALPPRLAQLLAEFRRRDDQG